MNDLFLQIKQTRNEFGISQTQLSVLADVSLATIQNIEAGKGNPSLSNLQNILYVLGIKIHLSKQKVNWDELNAHGLPLGKEFSSDYAVSVDSLVKLIILSVLELKNADSNSHNITRKKESLIALILALKTAFPTIYKKNLKSSKPLQQLISHEISGKIIKLKRIATTRLGEYL